MLFPCQLKSHFLVLLLTWCYLIAVASSKPKLNVMGEWVLVIPKNITIQQPPPLEIECTGDQPLLWKTKVQPEYYEVTPSKKNGAYSSLFRISQPFIDDTGYFNCSYVDDPTEVTSTYVYIFDNFTAFVKESQHSRVEMGIGDVITLDCRTTHPDIKVKVYKNNIEDVTEKFEVDDFYRFSKRAESLQETGIYACRATGFPVESTWLVSVQPTTSVQQPSIEKHRNSYHVVGHDFALNCSVPIGSSDNKLAISWTYPNTNSKKQDTNSRDNLFAINTLMVKNPTLNDSGEYTCAVVQGDYNKTDSIYIEVKEYIKPFVEFDKVDQSQKVISVPEGQDFQWFAYFTGFPDNLTYTFYDPLNRTLDSRNSRIKTDLSYLEGKLTLLIDKIHASDFGLYLAELKTFNGEKTSLDVVLIVNATPKVEFETLPRDVVPDDRSVYVSTNILSYDYNPEPKVVWFFNDECPNGIGSCGDPKPGHRLPNSTLNRLKPKNRFKSSVSFIPKSSGQLGFVVIDNFGRNSTQTDVIVSDIQGRFVFKILTEAGTVDLSVKETATVEVIEGDEIRMMCAALNYLYNNLMFSSNGFEYSNCSTRLAAAKCITNMTAHMQFEGLYECTAQNKSSNQTDKKYLDIKIVASVFPTVLPQSNVSLKGETLSVKASKPFVLKCLVDGKPMPKITWFKDNQDIENIPNFVDNKERVFLKNKNQILEFKFAQAEYAGNYVCKIKSRVGEIQPFASVQVEGLGLRTWHWVIIAIAIIVIVSLSGFMAFLLFQIQKERQFRNELRQNQLYLFEKGNIGDLNQECTVDEQAELLPYNNAFEVEKERIKIGKQLGTGAFGRVMQADVEDLEVRGRTTRVAVKMCKDGADPAHIRSLTIELKIMVHLGKHLNIVNLMGAYTVNMDKGDLWILVEYCKYGNLLKFIQKCKSRYVNQIDPQTGIIDIQRTSPYPNDPLSPNSVGRTSFGFGGSSPPQTDSDGYLESRSKLGSFRSFRSQGRHPSVNSNPDSNTGGSLRPGFYAGNPHYATAGFVRQGSSQSSKENVIPMNETGGSGDHYVTAGQLPSNKSTSRQSSNSEGPQVKNFNSDMTLETSVPFSPTSPGGEFFFDSQGNPIMFDCGGVPGIDAPFTTSDLVCWAWQIANGMEYLTRRKVLHGDLAARNILLAENNVVKISDFGFSKDIYKTDIYMKKGDEIMPIKWMSPEAIQQKLFSIQSDVWAFGITLWELFTLGNTPYPGIPLDPNFTIMLENGMRMEKPKFCNEQLYDMMLQCWSSHPMDRPSFSRIADTLADMLSPENKENYVAMNTIHMNQNAKWMESGQDYLSMMSSPDFENLQVLPQHMSADSNYIPMQTYRSNTDSTEINPVGGYLDMRSVRTSPVPNDTVFSPRPQSPEESEQIFNFSSNGSPLSEDQQSPVETSILLDQDEKSPKKSNPTMETSKLLQNQSIDNKTLNNNNKSMNDQKKNEPEYKNLEMMTHKNLQNLQICDDDIITSNDDVMIQYVNIPKVAKV